MTDCLSLLDTRVDVKQLATWTHTRQLTHVLHTEKIKINSVAKGNLEIEPFCIEMDCRIVGALVYHCCDEGVIHSWTDEVIQHVFDVDSTSQPFQCTLVDLHCWELNPKLSPDDNVVCWTADPCQRLHELRCCEMDWLKNGKKTSWNFRDSSGSTTYLSENRLTRLIAQAEAECDAQNCRNTRCVSYQWDPGICG